MRGWITGLVIAGLLAACSDGPAPLIGEGGAGGSTASSGAEFAWAHLGQVEAVLPGRAAAELVTDEGSLARAWATYRFPADAPRVDFEHEVVLLLGQADDACPDTLVALDVVGGRLDVAWLSPPGGCNQPLIMRLHAVRVHRGHLAERFDYGLPSPFDTDLEPVVLELPPYDGEAPPAPSPPWAMGDAELDAVFADHPIRRCGPDDELVRTGVVDGPLSSDPVVAGFQRQRAQFGIASDEATVRRVMGAADQLDTYGFPMLPEEMEADVAASNLVQRATGWLAREGWSARDLTPMIDRSDGIRAAVVVGRDDADRVRSLLDEEFGAGAVRVRVAPWSLAEVAEAQDAVGRALGMSLVADGAPGSIAWVTGAPGPVMVGMIDPTRAALDALAQAVDPGIVCVSPVLSGVAR